MNITEYFVRTRFSGTQKADLNTLVKLHECHVNNIPFENLDVQSKIPITLESNHLYAKIIENHRGGFCYELNYLFWVLLLRLGYKAIMVSARIFDYENLGPEFDHMSLIIKLNDEYWLADVGFGDLFVKPLNIGVNGVQHDGRHYFKIENWENQSFLLSMSKNGIDFEKKYIFQNSERKIKEFYKQCEFKQSSPNSYFVKNKVITLPTSNGRKTIFNSKYIIKNNGVKSEFIIDDRKNELKILKKEFNIVI